MQITVRLHGEATKYLANGRDRAEVTVAPGSTVEQVLAGLGMPREEYWLVALNGAVTPVDAIVQPGDLVECVAPISGG